MAKEKLERAIEKRRLKIMDEVVTGSTIDLPPILIEAELDKMLGEMRGEIERMGLRFEDYLGHLKKSVTDLRTAWQKDAEKRVRFGLALDEIANLEKLEGSKEEIEHEVKHLLEHYPDANPASVQNYVTAMTRHNLVFAWLEKQK
jgi:trigger factor